MMRLWISYLQLVELFVSSLVHMLYGFYIFSSAVAGDLSQALNEYFHKVNNVNVEVREEISKPNQANDLPPIVLVHGIFGFGKGVSPIVFSPPCFLSSFTFLMDIGLFLFWGVDLYLNLWFLSEIGGFIILCWGREEG